MGVSGARRRRWWRGARLSAQLLAAHRLRTALSVSGLLVGVAAVMVMAAIGEGAQRRLVERVRATGTDLLVVSPAPAPAVAGRQRQQATLTLLRADDAAAIAEESMRVREAAAGVSARLVVRWEGRNTTTQVAGVPPTGLAVRNIAVERGRPFDEDEERERRRVALLGRTVVRTLFGTADPIGREVRIGNVPFEVIGEVRPRGVDPGGADLDDVVVIPLETAMRRVLNIPYVHGLFVQARSTGELETLETEVREILRRRHRVRAGVADPFIVQNQAVLLRTERGTARTLRRLVAGTGVLALVVGGVGILTVMLLSVRERTYEIGLRRAVGARRADIRLQFLLEAGMLAAAGGVGGVVAGAAIAAVAALVGPWELALSWRWALAGIASSVLLGLAVGVVPAIRAARLEPVDALRGSR